MTRVPLTPPAHLPSTLGALRTAEPGSAAPKSVKVEIRDNLLAALRAGRDPWPGIVGFESTVLPQLERALLAGHDVVLLGERGQGKTRLLRALVGLLDEWTPVIAGSELGEHPLRRRSRRPRSAAPPSSVTTCRSRGATATSATPRSSPRPDTAVADLIGDVDPVKVAEGRSLGDPETIHYGLVPRAHRGIVAINELPDLAERIQVALLNVMEERDIQVRGYTLRLPLDVLLVASANPEDYTNRGRIITPLKDRFGAEVRTHYPLELADEIAVIEQEAELVAAVPRHLLEVVARFTRSLRESSAVDQGSGVSARFSVAAAETVAAAALRRAAITGERAARSPDRSTSSRCRTCCAASWSSPRARRAARPSTLTHLLRRATADTARARLRGHRPDPAGRGRRAVAGAHRGAGARARGRRRAAPHARADRGGPAARRGRHRGPGPDGQPPPSWRWSCSSSPGS